MSSPSIGRGPDPITRDRLAAMLGSHVDEEQRVVPLGAIPLGLSSSIRFRASRATEWVTVHVQSSVSGLGSATQGLFCRGFGRIGTDGLFARGFGIGQGGLAYNPAAAVSTTLVDCRLDRQQDLTISRDGVNRFVVYLIPEFLEVDGTYTSFDGLDAEDHMAYIDLGV